MQFTLARSPFCSIDYFVYIRFGNITRNYVCTFRQPGQPKQSSIQAQNISFHNIQSFCNNWLYFLSAGDQVLEWNGIPLTGKTYEEVQGIISQPNGEIELVVRP